MDVHMAEDEKFCFASFLRAATHYVEFGCGGSTVFAASLVSGGIISLDSSRSWLDQVASVCAANPSLTQPRLIFADIGPTGEWGHPADDSCRDRWPIYSSILWEQADAADADLFLVDGRFRVACVLETILRCRADAVILIHDFAPRVDYHRVKPFVREIATASTLSAFVSRPDSDKTQILELLSRARFESA